MNTLIQTKRGNIDISDIVIGDTVYEFNTGTQLRVFDIIRNDITPRFKLTLTDGRSAIYGINDSIALGGIPIEISTLIDSPKLMKTEINYKPIEYNRVNSTLRPDPYIAGALLVNGDQDEQYVNLPSSQLAANYQFSTMYGVEYGEKIGSDISYYSNNPYDKSDILDWEYIFPHYDIYFKDHKFDRIPIQYMRSSESDRWQFIRGVFDIGYYSDAFPDGLGIVNANEDVLIQVQQILLSLGILSKIEYEDVSIPSKPYHLTIIGKFDKYPGMFYNYAAIKDMIVHNRIITNRHNTFKLTIDNIERVEDGPNYNLAFCNKHEKSYLLDNFMMKVSM